jgi:hypothetical protein
MCAAGSALRKQVQSTWTQLDASDLTVGPYLVIARDPSGNIVLRQRLNVVR